MEKASGRISLGHPYHDISAPNPLFNLRCEAHILFILYPNSLQGDQNTVATQLILLKEGRQGEMKGRKEGSKKIQFDS